MAGDYVDVSELIRYEVPNITLKGNKIQPSDIEEIKIGSIEKEINNSNIFTLVKNVCTYSGGNKLLCTYSKKSEKGKLKVQSYWNSGKFKIKFNGKCCKDTLDLIDRIKGIINRKENFGDIEELFTSD
ncbi:MAG: hypothetical protein JSW73_01585 [Candidatus Woesearchaeota archaeon]|nr:MAG: hypothetical protein JSW73_01585 [Candidatus Woesearchaeota archaeon]